MMSVQRANSPDDFVSLYEQALHTQGWSSVDPLVDDDVCVTFSNGAVHKGKPAVRNAFEQNFAAIAEEEYKIANVHWVRRGENVAVYLFEFHWKGRINNQPASGSGRGTTVLRNDGSGWRLLVEHLGPVVP